MLLLKVTGAAMTIAASTAIGLYFSIVLQERIQDLKDLKKNLLLLRGDIKFTGTPLPEAMEAISIRCENTFQDFFKTVAEKLNSQEGATFQEIWKECVEVELKLSAMNKKDKMQLKKLGENLGYLDKEMQINTIDLYLSQLEGEIEESSSTMKEKKKLYHTLGIMGGIFITIIMI